MIRTRFAPSPTGELHIGGMRTALFAYLFAKHNDGEFLLRIEDTDHERYVEGATVRIIEALEWFDLFPDNYHSIVIQSKRLPIYRQYALELVKRGEAYVCTCSKERLEKLRKEQQAKGLPAGYDRRCREIANSADLPEGAVIRLKMPESGKAEFDDLVRGRIEFDLAIQDDPVLLKSDGWPTYHLAAVIDDHQMEISHVIRGEEWLSSTPKHITLYKALGWQVPAFAHLPVILGPDKKKKLSKRDGDVSVLEFSKKGYLPDALINFIALLGWNPKDEREEFSLAQLIKEFKIENVSKSPAVFNIEKLNSINAAYIQQRDAGKLEKELIQAGLQNQTAGEIALAQRGGFKTLKEIVETIEDLRREPEYDSSLLVFKKSDPKRTKCGLELARQKLASANIWSNEELQNDLSEIVEFNNLANGDVFWPVRAALSGQEKSASPVELLYALGKPESLKRIDRALKKMD